MKHQYNQLVRDRIPEIIKESGRRCEFKVLSNSEMRTALTEKLLEKANIFSKKPSEDELSDIYELLGAITENFEFEPMHIDYLKLQNKEHKGSYSGRVFLISVEDTE
ncbi:MAG: nucleoside triphosphate pyrophosphohydrolase [Eubacterium aggregans]|uniref:Predicted house-cleaning noncanonical NTP pyrophosphatase, all-alpha NTP-PPase (MazG) superfamily n=1 Tax=Eubacterium aggregans TaxID=81409 RepID=A0A1H3XU54_9FIRM|nr:nucleoside triphosphate pyrophosphohydrolase [Eubacterium aggregans]MDD4690756.1 nucleoside triphosphate pyrophosphohydrolase [Eubacterium aggregans]MEA5072748.1 nucleoside triphosphate pyrophosphohydrolase [Eubacterium aggregans]SEA02863.1 Predicted house-cleaning noncanonical NTP pyrophosphatase, all-alpha NTP-PPase (MazG) superfamily [Eubacterium aggregans]